jgi:Protease inhibitor Inh
MIPKSGTRFSEKIMRNAPRMITGRAAGGVLIVLILAGCAGSPFGNSTPEAPAAPTAEMAGRWMLSAPNAPSCGMNFGGAPGAQQGTVAPEGGCPGKFFTSRHWTLEQGSLTINDHDNQPLARLSFAGGRFEGQATAGMAVTLSR